MVLFEYTLSAGQRPARRGRYDSAKRSEVRSTIESTKPQHLLSRELEGSSPATLCPAMKTSADCIRNPTNICVLFVLRRFSPDEQVRDVCGNCDSDREAESSSKGWLQSIIRRAVANLTLKVTNLVLKYEGSVRPRIPLLQPQCTTQIESLTGDIVSDGPAGRVSAIGCCCLEGGILQSASTWL